MSKIWSCRKCGQENEGPSCANCGIPKRHPFDYNFLIFLDCGLILFILLVLIKVIPTFAEVFAGFGAKLPWPQDIFIRWSNFSKTFPGELIFGFGCLAGLTGLILAIKNRVKFMYWVILFWLLLLILIFLVFSVFGYTGGLGNIPN